MRGKEESKRRGERREGGGVVRGRVKGEKWVLRENVLEARRREES